MKHKGKSVHRLACVELGLGQVVAIRSFITGDVFIRNGTPCMVVRVSDNIGPVDKTWICNLQSGSVWPVSSEEQVYPCYDVELSLKSARRDQ